MQIRMGAHSATRLAAVLTAPLMTCVILACGPQAVPLPPIRNTTQPGAGSMSGIAGRTQVAAAGSGAAPAPPVAGTGNAAIGGGVGVTGGSFAPPVAGSAGTLPTSGLPMAGGASNGVPSDFGTDPNRNHVMPGQLCSRLAVIQCAAEQHCCSNPGRTESQCQMQSVSDCMTDPSIDAIAGVRSTGFDPTTAASVFEQLETRSANCDVGLAEWSLGPSGVRTILKGTVAAKGSCKPTGDITVKVNEAAGLASCMNSETTGCLPQSLLGAWTCEQKGGADSKCISDDNCQTGLYCTPPSPTFGKCAQRKANGASCMAPTECTSLICKNSSCVAADQQSAFCPN